MTTRLSTRFGWLLAFSFVLTLVSAPLTAADVPVDTAVALRPASEMAPPVSSPVAPTAPGYFDPALVPNYQNLPPPASSPVEDRQMEITARYQDSRMLGFLQTTNMNQIASLFTEVSRMIDSRHVSPLSYEDRTRAALDGVISALNNPTFLQAAGYRSAVSTQQLQSELAQLKQSPARSSTEALGMLQYVAELANRRIGVRREAVALEFFNESIDSLDKYSAFIPSKTGFGPGAVLEEQVVGIGVELKKHDNGALINDTIPNSPASQGGLQKGDVITGINNRSVQGMSLDQIAGQIGGSSGTSVSLQINRNGQVFSRTLTRRSVYVGSVSGAQMLTSTVGYVKLKQFSENSKEDLEKAMLQLWQQQGMKTLVLDLRGNPGGLLTEAIDVADLFVPSGRIVATRGRNAGDNMDEQATWERTWSIPLVVLVDGDSASASEILAAAIQENRRGVIVGRTTYGKGTVQTHFPLQTVSGELKLTTAKFYSPNGREMAGSGVTPDYHVNTGSQPFTGTLAQDPDVAAAMQVASTAQQLATASGQRRN